MVILGISAYYHDSSATLIINNKLIACAQEERFSRIKNDESFPLNAIKYCLKEGNITINDVVYIVFYDKPFIKFERLLETYLAFAPIGFLSFLKAIPVWIKQKLFFKKLIYKGFKNIEGFNNKSKIYFSEHHLSHAASVFFASNFKQAAILTIDGVGEWATTCIYIGNGNDITLLKQINFPHSIGLLYSAVTYFCGFKVNSGEYKLMGLAPYGNLNSESVTKYIDLIKKHLLTIYSDGSFYINQSFFKYATGLTMTNTKKWEELFLLKKRNESDELTQQHCDLALAIQLVTEEVVIKLATEALKLTNEKNLCLSGGVALNCVANGKLLKEKVANTIYIQPSAGDAGGSLGAALAFNYIYLKQPRVINVDFDNLKGSFLGPQFSNKEVLNELEKYNFNYQILNEDELYNQTAHLISEGNIIGWFQGRMEFGPRALGNRSILADSRNNDMQKKLNLSIKYRESFRPFAPCVLLEDAQHYFDLQVESPYMLFVAGVNDKIKTTLPSNFNDLSMLDKINSNRSTIPAVTHLDYSSRIQTVSPLSNNKLYLLLSAFKKLTNCSVLVNTSFNVRGEPIVCSPTDAYECFMETEMDYLIINNILIDKKQQPDWKKEKRKFKSD